MFYAWKEELVSKHMLMRWAAKAAMVAALVVGGVVAVPAAAQAAPAATCSYSLGWSTASGGCNHYAPITTRMVLTCQVIGSHFTYTRVSSWYSGQWICWGVMLYCHGGTARAKSVQFQAQ